MNDASATTPAPSTAAARRPAVALTIAGSDPSGGAGIQADLKTFHALGVYGTSSIAAVTSENTVGVRGVHQVPAEFMVSQAEAVLDDLPVDATKIGMLGTAESIQALAGLLSARREEFGLVVLDPVMVATSGDPLLSADADRALREDLVPLADLITPNLPEGARLLGTDAAGTEAELRDQAAALLDLGPRAVLLKGGHLADGEALDVLALAGPDGVVLHELTAPRVATRNTHGTGCTLSSAIAAHAARARHRALVLGREPAPQDDALFAAVRAGKEFLTRALADAADWRLSRTPEQGHGPVDHLSQTLR